MHAMLRYRYAAALFFTFIARVRSGFFFCAARSSSIGFNIFGGSPERVSYLLKSFSVLRLCCPSYRSG